MRIFKIIPENFSIILEWTLLNESVLEAFVGKYIMIDDDGCRVRTADELINLKLEAA